MTIVLSCLNFIAASCTGIIPEFVLVRERLEGWNARMFSRPSILPHSLMGARDLT